MLQLNNFILRTALAEAELEYDDKHISPSLTLRLKLNRLSNHLAEYCSFNIYALIWTTTPWTLPTNQAVCYSSDLKYCLVRLDDSNDRFVVAESLMPELSTTLNLEPIEVLVTFPGAELDSCSYLDPIAKKEELPFLAAQHVTSAKGTGLVHTAPAHGFDDYLICLKNNIKMVIKYEACYYNESKRSLKMMIF